MTIEIRPDPNHPMGGYARLALDPPPAGEQVLVSVFDAFSQRHLGEAGWQATPVAFGPYPVERSAAGAALRIGPEIVNQMEEYAAIRLTVGDRVAEVHWPDDVVPRPGAAVLGGLHVLRPDAPVTRDNLVGPTPVAPPPSDPAPPATPPPVVDPPPPAPPARRWLIPAGIVLLLAIGAGALLMRGPEPSPPTEVPPAAPPPVASPAAVAPDCGPDALAALSAADFAGAMPRLTECGASVAPPVLLSLIEGGVDRGDGAALLQMGELYDRDAGATGVVEQVIGLSFDDDPANAASYYARAREAGAVLAPDRLAAVCARLADRSDTLSQAAREDHCRP